MFTSAFLYKENHEIVAEALSRCYLEGAREIGVGDSEALRKLFFAYILAEMLVDMHGCSVDKVGVLREGRKLLLCLREHLLKHAEGGENHTDIRDACRIFEVFYKLIDVGEYCSALKLLFSPYMI